jgi:hypothetical protein
MGYNQGVKELIRLQKCISIQRRDLQLGGLRGGAKRLSESPCGTVPRALCRQQLLHRKLLHRCTARIATVMPAIEGT